METIPAHILDKVSALMAPYGLSVVPTPARASRPKETHIGICLDSSGSMGSIRNDIIGAYNSTIDQIEKDAANLGEVFVTLVVFGEHFNEVTVKYNHEPLARLKKLTNATYIPQGSTPFYDGLGTLTGVMADYDHQDDGVDRAFLINVFTDGEENASKEWRLYALKARVQALQHTGRWTFTYAGANVNLDQVAHDIGLPRANMVGYTADAYGTYVMQGQHVNSMQSYGQLRSMGVTSSSNFYQQGQQVGQQINVGPDLANPALPPVQPTDVQSALDAQHWAGKLKALSKAAAVQAQEAHDKAQGLSRPK